MLDLQHWHKFFKVLKRAGYPSAQLISSQVAVLYTYALWLIGKRDFKVDPYQLREVMARWFFMAALTGRYTGSPESRMEQDLALLRGLTTPEQFVKTLDEQIDAILTRDYWSARNTDAYYSTLDNKLYNNYNVYK
ncbi:MAG: hypothetical protein PWQ31_90 [Eubacteriales bacterium]|nr:hypothetical protein [Eubacteriales bacterium]